MSDPHEDLIAELRAWASWFADEGPIPDTEDVAMLPKTAMINTMRAGAQALSDLQARVGEETAKRVEAEGEAEDFKERLRDLVMIDAEEWAIGGGPGFRDRSDKAWTRAREPFEP